MTISATALQILSALFAMLATVIALTGDALYTNENGRKALAWRGYTSIILLIVSFSCTTLYIKKSAKESTLTREREISQENLIKKQNNEILSLKKTITGMDNRRVILNESTESGIYSLTSIGDITFLNFKHEVYTWIELSIYKKDAIKLNIPNHYYSFVSPSIITDHTLGRHDNNTILSIDLKNHQNELIRQRNIFLNAIGSKSDIFYNFNSQIYIKLEYDDEFGQHYTKYLKFDLDLLKDKHLSTKPLSINQTDFEFKVSEYKSLLEEGSGVIFNESGVRESNENYLIALMFNKALFEYYQVKKEYPCDEDFAFSKESCLEKLAEYYKCTENLDKAGCISKADYNARMRVLHLQNIFESTSNGIVIVPSGWDPNYDLSDMIDLNFNDW
ncbi:hypothetical protein [Vibrio alginolyticus]|uniref:hypothetical protein n=1 Tax=Vibrio alginolyticus TaxID=663 RepID=UPI002160EEEF|nr:hypothetical protein [Vibrio alginolyticus]MCS0174284.1 hypothetical protein [Vibrio alginolyticus]